MDGQSYPNWAGGDPHQQLTPQQRHQLQLFQQQQIAASQQMHQRHAMFPGPTTSDMAQSQGHLGHPLFPAQGPSHLQQQQQQQQQMQMQMQLHKPGQVQHQSSMAVAPDFNSNYSEELDAILNSYTTAAAVGSFNAIPQSLANFGDTAASNHAFSNVPVGSLDSNHQPPFLSQGHTNVNDLNTSLEMAHQQGQSGQDLGSASYSSQQQGAPMQQGFASEPAANADAVTWKDFGIDLAQQPEAQQQRQPQQRSQPQQPASAGPLRTQFLQSAIGNGDAESSSAASSSHQGRASWDGSAVGLGADGPFGPRNIDLRTGNRLAFADGNLGQLTPGAESSDTGNTSSGSTKRRRMTFSGGDSSHAFGRGRPTGIKDQAPQQQHQQQDPQGLGLPTVASHPNRSQVLQAFPRGKSNIVSSKDLEAMATESLNRANAENQRTTDDTGHLSALPSNFYPQSRPSTTYHQRSSSSADLTGTVMMGMGGSPPMQAMAQMDGDAAQEMSPPGDAEGKFNRNVMPSNLQTFGGSSMIKASDIGFSSVSAANDFTRRKGWATRVVDELLDFAHVLDPKGNIMYAANAVHALTGWQPEQIRGKSIFEFVHPEDHSGLKQSLIRAAGEKTDVTMYYRMKRNPAQINSRAKNRLNNAEAEVGEGPHKGESSKRPPGTDSLMRSRSTSLSVSTDESLLQTNSEESSSRVKKNRPNPAAVGEVDPDAEWVTLEMTGHAHFAPLMSLGENAKENGAPPTETDGNLQDDEENDDGGEEDSKQGIKKNDAEAAPRKSLDEDGSGKGRRRESLFAAVNERSQKKYDLPLARSEDVQCFFCSGRVYPSKSVTVLDSFLELKLENEKLRQQLENLKINGSGAAEGIAAGDFLEGDDSEINSSADLDGDVSTGPSSDLLSSSAADHPARRPPLAPRLSSTAATVGSVRSFIDTRPGEGGDQGESGGQPQADSSDSGAAEREGGDTPVAGQSAEGSNPQSGAGATNSTGTTTATGNSDGSPTVAATSNAASAAAIAALKKKKKLKQPEGDEDRVCTDCGRTDSPEWRKGPMGPKTLCNACGLRYAKKVKRKSHPPIAIPGTSAFPPHGHGNADESIYGAMSPSSAGGGSMAPPSAGIGAGGGNFFDGNDQQSYRQYQQNHGHGQEHYNVGMPYSQGPQRGYSQGRAHGQRPHISHYASSSSSSASMSGVVGGSGGGGGGGAFSDVQHQQQVQMQQMLQQQQQQQQSAGQGQGQSANVPGAFPTFGGFGQ